MCYNYWLDYHAPSDNVYKANVSKLIVRALTFLVFRASFADEISKVSLFFLARGLAVKVKGRVEKQDCNEQ